MTMRTKFCKVVVIGGGFGGLNIAKALKNGPAELLVIDKMNHHLFQPLLYQVASAALSPADIASPIREILSGQKNTTVILGEVISIDKQRNELIFNNGEVNDFDVLVVAVGTRHSYFGNDAWESFAPGVKTLNDALQIREMILMSFENAERCNNPTTARKHLNFVIVGGGPTGVEMAGAISEIAHMTMLKDFKRINPDTTKIFLIEGGPNILSAFPEKLSKYAEKSLEEMGVEVIHGNFVTNITEHGVQVGDEFIESTNVIWAAGNQASPLLKTLDVPLDNQGRVIVEPDLSIPGNDNIYVIGDAAHCVDKGGAPLPGIAPVAIQQSKYLAKHISRGTPKKSRPPFRYFDKGMMATIGKAKAILIFRNFYLSGFLAWLLWGGIHIAYLIGFRNRALVMFQWVCCYLRSRRGVRIIKQTLKDYNK